ncbi:MULTISPECIES: acetylornithine deacetylase [Variovorax]|uniref:acetylornithine deacetylase n=1 Tax=Variovorax TaxID=34072 RepID=UPI00086E7314|nr:MULTISPECIES: acetylornithine deacetylase [Variovorax]MBN8754204.1 acetylornithine deacetylase [Variovorax sp.]ODU18636.1 MAG: acetylornithine deacetylase (ArgE) [Variovorax sp. SCN 67-85]ODV25151.1 MAG: acetylornithine deacetylase (ArgE) [Variovorax sp. SCN 67-20]OJZ05124.1 MAG: acetylornithine deacetylase (ArgE) [Variovorax sp. 67-131]UKI09092.1 acetylornithine deacetylase [Variovorax paradoxus]
MLHTLSPQSLLLAQTLVRMNTVSANSNLELIDFAQSHLKALGVQSRITYNAERTKANLFATLGEGKPAGVIVSGHTDTVPWDGQDWSVDPLSAIVQNERLYGRGSADMKSFIAIALANAGRFLESDSPFAVHFAFSYDEEVGCFGVKELIADMRDAGINPLACIVGEPTSMVPAIAHKGVYRYKCCVRGKEAHSSLTPKSVNAIEMAARVIGKVRDMAEDFERNEPRYEGFDVPFSTASVGQFHGGIADNVVPRDAEFRYEFRDLPTADAKRMQADVMAYAGSIEPAMKKVAPDAGFSFETICEIPSFLGAADNPVTKLAQRLAGEEGTTLVAFGTEAGLFKNAGIPTVVCGPGSIEQAHQPDEFVSLEQLARCELFMQRLASSPTIG